MPSGYAHLLGERAKLQALIDSENSSDNRWLRIVSGRMERKLGDEESAERIFRQVLTENPRYRIAMEELIRFYYERRDLQSIRDILSAWVSYNPEDREVVELLRNIEGQLRKLDSVSGENP